MRSWHSPGKGTIRGFLALVAMVVAIMLLTQG